jgi:hypothetical protein
MVVVIGLLALTGCTDERRGQQETPADKQPLSAGEMNDQRLTGELAKRALLEIDKEQIRAGLFHLIPLPKDEPIQVVGPDEIAIGIYHCNLKEKTFHAETFYPNADRHKHNRVSGVFEKKADGKWAAKVTDAGHSS